MLKNDQLDEWDRSSFFHPSTHLAQHARGESPSRVIKTASGVSILLRLAAGFIRYVKLAFTSIRSLKARSTGMTLPGE